MNVVLNSPDRAVSDNRKVVIFSQNLRIFQMTREQGGDYVEELTGQNDYFGDYRRDCCL